MQQTHFYAFRPAEKFEGEPLNVEPLTKKIHHFWWTFSMTNFPEVIHFSGDTALHLGTFWWRSLIGDNDQPLDTEDGPTPLLLSPLYHIITRSWSQQ